MYAGWFWPAECLVKPVNRKGVHTGGCIPHYWSVQCINQTSAVKSKLFCAFSMDLFLAWSAWVLCYQMIINCVMRCFLMFCSRLIFKSKDWFKFGCVKISFFLSFLLDEVRLSTLPSNYLSRFSPGMLVWTHHSCHCVCYTLSGLMSAYGHSYATYKRKLKCGAFSLCIFKRRHTDFCWVFCFVFEKSKVQPAGSVAVYVRRVFLWADPPAVGIFPVGIKDMEETNNLLLIASQKIYGRLLEAPIHLF